MPIDAIAFAARLRMLLPKGWFADDAPILGSILNSFAVPWAWLSDTLSYAGLQTRLSTATDEWLDLAGQDYFGLSFARLPGEADGPFRIRIESNLLTEAGTRQALIDVVGRISGFAARVFEPAKAGDTGAYGTISGASALSGCGLAYGSAGGWGSLALPYQVFITIETAAKPGEPAPTGYGVAGGGYTAGSLAYNTISDLPGRSTDDDVRTAICGVLPVCCTAWLRFA